MSVINVTDNGKVVNLKIVNSVIEFHESLFPIIENIVDFQRNDDKEILLSIEQLIQEFIVCSEHNAHHQSTAYASYSMESGVNQVFFLPFLNLIRVCIANFALINLSSLFCAVC